MSIKFLYTLLAMLLCLPTFSQTNQSTLFKDNHYPFILGLNWLNEQFLDRQRNRIDAMTRKRFGQGLQTGKSNITLLQRIIDEQLVPQNATQDLQAMGVVLGDIFVESHKNLNWQIYEDELGKSHAVCVENTNHCLFPVTMLSRRIEVGSRPNVTHLYNKGVDAMKTFLPQLPFSD